jgi:iron complex outermembrane receptor protein
VAQAQNFTAAGERQRFTYGIDLHLTRPVTDGTITGQNEDSDDIDEAGVYLQSETDLVPGKLDLVIAGRADYHNRLEDIVLSPRAALVFRPATGHTLRLTYNRAYSTPNTTELFLDILAQEITSDLLPGFAITVRGSGIPESGYTFSRDGRGRPYFYSPLSPVPGQAIPVDEVALLWPGLVQIAAANGFDLSSLPVPDTSDIRAVLKRYSEATGTFESVNDVRDIPGLQPTITRTVEVGYVGTIGEGFRAGLDIYHTRVTNFIGQFEVITPNVFMNSADVRSYLQNHGVAPVEVLALSAFAEILPLGTVTPDGVADRTAIVAAPRNFGNLSLWGTDLSIDFMPGRMWTLSGTFSVVSRNYYEKLDGAEDLSLNTPKQRGTLTVRYRNTDLGVNAEVRGRWITGFRMMSGVYTGDVGAYTLLDATAGAALPWFTGAAVAVTVQNLFDRRHREFVGAPEIGRLIMGRVQYTL